MQLLSEPRIAVLGAGHVGPVIARMASVAGYHVSIAASGDPKKIELMTEILVPGAEPRWAAEAVADADIVVLSIPLHRFADLDPGAVDAVAEVVERIGYDAVRLDSLSAGRLLEPGGPVFGVSLHRAEFELAVLAQVA